MELKIESGTLSLTTENTTHGIGQALIELANRFGEVGGYRTPDTKITVFDGIDVDARFQDGAIKVSVRSLLGWTTRDVPLAEAEHVLKLLGAAIAEAQASIAGAKPSLQ